MDEYTGRCLCGNIRFKVSAPATFPHFCSCSQCQRWSGAPVVAWIDFPAKSLVWDGPGGEPSLFRTTKETQRAFCSQCGSALAAIDDDSDTVCFTIGTLDEPNLFVPESHSFRSEAPTWLQVKAKEGTQAR